jgi:hypothetical protein
MKCFVPKHFWLFMIVLLLFTVSAPCYDWDDSNILSQSTTISSIDLDDIVSDVHDFHILSAAIVWLIPVTVCNFFTGCTAIVLAEPTPLHSSVISRAPPALS